MTIQSLLDFSPSAHVGRSAPAAVAIFRILPRVGLAVALVLLTYSLMAADLDGSTVYIVTFRDLATATDPRAVAQGIADAHGGAVVDVGEGFARIRLTASRARVVRSDPRVAAVASAAPSGVAADGENVTWASGVSYTYDGSGNIMDIGPDMFRYDMVGRLVQSRANGVEREFEYDRYGNRKKCVQNAATAIQSDCQGGRITDPATNRIAGVSYDDSGNVTVLEGAFTYDALNMPTSAHHGTIVYEYVYTADDERLAVYTASARSWLWTVRDTSGKVLREFRSADGPLGVGTANWQWSKDYIWRDGVLLATMQQRPGMTAPTVYHYHVDHLGTPRRITDDDDVIVGIHDYHPFGQELSGGRDEYPLSRMKYTGHERDIFVGTESSSTLDYMHARYYSPVMGRFLSVDPSRDSIDPRRPQTWNRYAYALNNPMTLVDPTGLNAEVFCDQYGDCTAAAVAQVVADPADAVAMQTANDFKQAAESYWNGRTTTGPNGENVTFSLTLNIVAPGQQAAGVDTVTVVDGAGVSYIGMTLGPQPIPDTGEIFTNDTTGNPSGMAGIGPHEAGHLYGIRDMYWVTADGTREQVPYNPSPNADIMRHAQPTNGAHTAFMVMSPSNRNVVIFRQSGPRTGCRC